MLTDIRRLKSKRGLTLVELLAVVVIVAVLAAIAIPMYTGYMVRARRADAKTALEQIRAAQEMMRAERGRYSVDLTLAELRNTWGGPGTTVGDYTISLAGATSTVYNGVATPNTARQTADGALQIDQNGVKTPTDKWLK